VVTEIQRVREFRVALAHHEVSQAGRLMTTSHASLRDDFEVSCRELDVLADCALKEGAIGARMMGAGFGGSTLNLLPQKLAEAFVSAMETRYGEITGNACQSFIVNAVDGAGVRSLEPN
jgi:galactokinase